MPGFDGTGPYGDGPAGRGYGPCGRTSKRGWDRFSVRRRGWFGRVGPMIPSYDLNDEIADLEQEKSFLEKRLADLRSLIGKKEEDR